MGEDWNEYRIDILHRLETIEGQYDSIQASLTSIQTAMAAQSARRDIDGAAEERRLKLWLVIAALISSLLGGGISTGARAIFDEAAKLPAPQNQHPIYHHPTAQPLPLEEQKK